MDGCRHDDDDAVQFVDNDAGMATAGAHDGQVTLRCCKRTHVTPHCSSTSTLCSCRLPTARRSTHCCQIQGERGQGALSAATADTCTPVSDWCAPAASARARPPSLCGMDGAAAAIITWRGTSHGAHREPWRAHAHGVASGAICAAAVRWCAAGDARSSCAPHSWWHAGPRPWRWHHVSQHPHWWAKSAAAAADRSR